MILQKLVKMSLTVAFLSLSACSTFPDIHPYILSIKNHACGGYKIVSKSPLKYEFDKWHDLSECDGFFAIPPEDVANVRAWYDAHYGNGNN